MSWLTDTELERAIVSCDDSRVVEAFRGVFPKDQLPKTHIVPPAFLVVNTDVSNLPGRHWKAIYIDENYKGEVFDSLATPVSNHVGRFMNRNTRQWKVNRTMVQHPLSSQCGAYVLYFVTQRLKFNSLRDLCHSFSFNLDENERRMRAFYRHEQ